MMERSKIFSGWLRIALWNLVLATILGALLRYAFVEEIEWLRFRNVLHGHSHTAMLGWLYLALFALFAAAFLNESANLRFYGRLFWATEFSVLGMWGSFPLQGYGPASIAFSSLHILLSYWWVWRFWKDTRHHRGSWSLNFARASMVFMVLSTLAIWSLGPILAGGFRSSTFFHLAVQFFLHFQFNGWFVFAALALLLKFWEQRGLIMPERTAKWFFILLTASCLLTYALAVAWSNPLPAVFAVNSLGVALQLGALGVFLIWILPRAGTVIQWNLGWDKAFILIAFFSFIVKILVQAAVVVPFVAKAAYTIRNYVIGFIHLILLGAVTGVLLSLALNQSFLNRRNLWTRAGMLLFVTGMIGSEVLLFLQGTLLWAAMGFIPRYYETIFGISVCMPLGAALVATGQWNYKDLAE